MTNAEFQKQIARLIEQFGKNVYSQGRLELIWNEIAILDVWVWKRAVDRLLLECRQTPLMPEIRDAIAKEREHAWGIKKQEHAKDAEEFFSSYSPEDIQTISGAIRDRIKGRLDDNGFNALQRQLKGVVDASERK